MKSIKDGIPLESKYFKSLFHPDSICFGFWWAWVWLLFFPGSMHFDGSQIHIMWMIFLLTSSLTLGALSLHPGASKLIDSVFARIASPLILAGMTALCFFALPTTLLHSFVMILGAFSALWMASCVARLASGDSKLVLFNMAVSLCLAVIIYLLVIGRPLLIEATLVSLLPLTMLLSSTPLHIKKKGGTKSDIKESKPFFARFKMKHLVLLVLFVSTTVFGVFKGYVTTSQNETMNIVIMLGIGVVTLAIALAAALSKESIRSESLFFVPLPFFIIGLAFLTAGIVSRRFDLIATLFILMGWSCTNILGWNAIAQKAKSGDYLKTIARGCFCWQFGTFTGTVLLEFSGRAFGQDSQFFIHLPLVTLVTMVVVMFAILLVVQAKTSSAKPKEKGGDVQEGLPADSKGATIKRIAEECGLSERETEILCVLVRGHNLPTVAKELNLAKSTVATHTQNIYRKTGVHSRQELLMFVEEAGDLSHTDPIIGE